MNLSILNDLLDPEGLKSCSLRFELERISFNPDSPFSNLMASNTLPRTSAAIPASTSCPCSSPPSYINRPITESETTFSVMTLANIRPRNSAALGASLTASSKTARTDSNLYEDMNKIESDDTKYV